MKEATFIKSIRNIVEQVYLVMISESGINWIVGQSNGPLMTAYIGIRKGSNLGRGHQFLADGVVII